MAFEQGAGVLQVLFGVGFGGGDAGKRLVENTDDALLFGERRVGYRNRVQRLLVELWLGRTRYVIVKRNALQI